MIFKKILKLGDQNRKFFFRGSKYGLWYCILRCTEEHFLTFQGGTHQSPWKDDKLNCIIQQNKKILIFLTLLISLFVKISVFPRHLQNSLQVRFQLNAVARYNFDTKNVHDVCQIVYHCDSNILHFTIHYSKVAIH